MENFIALDPHKFSEETKYKRKQINTKEFYNLKKNNYEIKMHSQKYADKSLELTEKLNEHIKDKSYVQFIPKDDKNTLGVVVEFKNKTRDTFLKETTLKDEAIVLNDKELTIINKKNNSNKETYNLQLTKENNAENNNFYVINPKKKNIITFISKKEMENFIALDPHKFSEETKYKRKQINTKELYNLKKNNYEIKMHSQKYADISLELTEKLNEHIKDKSYVQFIPKGDKNTLGVVVEFKNKTRDTFLKETTLKDEAIVLNDKEKILSAYRNGNILPAKEGYNRSLTNHVEIQVNSAIKNWNKINPHYNAFVMIASKEGDKIKSPQIIKVNSKMRFSAIRAINQECKEQDDIIAKPINQMSPITIALVANGKEIEMYNVNKKTIKAQVQLQRDIRNIQKEEENMMSKLKTVKQEQKNSPELKPELKPKLKPRR